VNYFAVAPEMPRTISQAKTAGRRKNRNIQEVFGALNSAYFSHFAGAGNYFLPRIVLQI
jgi:hypothetical protein